MPIPVTVPAVPLPNDDALTAVAEAFLTAMVQLVKNGTTGGSLTTPAMVVPSGNDPNGPSVPVTLDKDTYQLNYRHIGLSIATVLRSQIPSAVPTVQFTRTADSSGVTAGTGVYYSANDKVSTGDSSALAKAGCIGFAPAAIASSATGTIISIGLVTGVLSGATAGTAYYMGHDGKPALLTALSTGDQLVLLGYAKNATDLDVNIQRGGTKP